MYFPDKSMGFLRVAVIPERWSRVQSVYDRILTRDIEHSLDIPIIVVEMKGEPDHPASNGVDYTALFEPAGQSGNLQIIRTVMATSTDPTDADDAATVRSRLTSGDRQPLFQ